MITGCACEVDVAGLDLCWAGGRVARCPAGSVGVRLLVLYVGLWCEMVPRCATVFGSPGSVCSTPLANSCFTPALLVVSASVSSSLIQSLCL